MPVASADAGRSIEGIDFRRTETGAGRLIVNLSDVGTPVDVSRSGDNVVLGFAGTNLPDGLNTQIQAGGRNLSAGQAQNRFFNDAFAFQFCRLPADAWQRTI